MPTFLDWAKRYADLGYPVLPVSQEKTPLISGGLLSASTDVNQLTEWWGHKWPGAMIGLAVPDRICVIDFDSPSSKQLMAAFDMDLPTTAAQKTPRGEHLWYCAPEGVNPGWRPSTDFLKGIDIRAKGSYVIVAPSVRGGHAYEWITPPLPANITEAPQWLLELPKQPSSGAFMAEGGLDINSILAGVEQGQRDFTLFRFASKLRNEGRSRAEVEALVLHAASKCSPPFSPEKALEKVESAWKYTPGMKPVEKKIHKKWSLKELMTTDFPEPHWVVKDLLPEGLALVCAPPKTGKSFLLGGLVFSQAVGERAFGHFETTKGGAAYLDLEQSAPFAKQRWRILCDGKPLPDYLDTYFTWDRMDQGGLAAIEQEIIDNPALRIVVIDLLAKFWPAGVTEGANAYHQEYRVLTELGDLARKYHVAIVIVHHTNKVFLLSDPLACVSGSAAMTGVPDTIWIPYRPLDSCDGKIYVTGKHVRTQWLDMHVDSETGRWSYAGANMPTHAPAAPVTNVAQLPADTDAETTRTIADLLSVFADGLIDTPTDLPDLPDQMELA